MALDVVLLKEQLREDITLLTESLYNLPIIGPELHEQFEKISEKTVAFQSVVPRLRKRDTIEFGVVAVAKTLWEHIQDNQDAGKCEMKHIHFPDKCFESRYEKLIWIFFRNVYNITVEDMTQEEQQREQSIKDVIVPLLGSGIMQKVSWKNNPELIPYFSEQPSFPLPKFDQTGSAFNAALNASRINKEFCDAVLRVEDQEFPAHKVILSSRSPYFKGLFTSGMKESQDNEAIVIKETTSSSFSHFLEALYLQRPPQEKLSLEELFEFTLLTHRMQTVELFQWSKVEIKNRVSKENFYSIAFYAHVLGDKHLIAHCTWYFKKYGKDIPTADLKDCSLKEVVEYLDVSIMVHHKDLKTACKEHIRSAISLQSFEGICQLAIDQTQRGSTSLKDLCAEYVKQHKAAFEKEEMKEAKDLYKTLMSGLE